MKVITKRSRFPVFFPRVFAYNAKHVAIYVAPDQMGPECACTQQSQYIVNSNNNVYITQFNVWGYIKPVQDSEIFCQSSQFMLVLQVQHVKEPILVDYWYL